MERIDTYAVADANGDIHVHVGAPGMRFRVVIEAEISVEAANRALNAAYGGWADFEFERPGQGVLDPIEAIWPDDEEPRDRSGG